MKSSLNIPVVGAIIEQIIDGEKYILIQTRRKPGTEYHNTIETPVGWIEEWENIYDCLAREIKEETNLTVTHIIKQHTSTGNNSIGFNPFYCTQQLAVGLPWIMLCFVCMCEGDLKSQVSETRDPQWIKVINLRDFLDNNNIFDLQKPFFDYYIKHHDGIEYQELYT